MNPLQALALVTQVCENARLTLPEHRKTQEAISIIKNFISPPPKPGDKKPKDEKPTNN